ncbi:Cytochrome P450 88A1 [Camellia lanceoleosa]|uniref:Cytochrome P450 88A1 n=1 Tax=Camellia lanceoleosa TaxID=1840588 RepID=A0ACC0II04_9ERIC|nr:Cytochrome P450 88A1 [Camellia lanceoleosa]
MVKQEAIVNNMPPTQNGLTLNEHRQMEYLSKVIDETFRVVVPFPRDGKFWFGLGVCTSTLKSIPTRWHLILPDGADICLTLYIGITPKARTFLPFGAGSRLCPGNDLAKLEIAIFLHYFLLDYD